ncbi:helix-turn-helix transcriptional regulator [Dactylosporangium cerinum]
MLDDVANTSSRTLTLLSLLQTHRHWPGAQLADRLGVSERTLRRDVDRLRELGYPVQASRGTDGGYQLARGPCSRRCCSTTTKPSRWRSAWPTPPRAASPVRRRRRSAR